MEEDSADNSKSSQIYGILSIALSTVPVLGLIFGVIGLLTAKDNRRGKKLSAIGLVLSIVFASAYISLLLVMRVGQSETPSSQEVKSNQYSYADEVGLSQQVDNGKLTIKDIGVSFSIPAEVDDLLYRYTNAAHETIFFTTESLAESEYKAKNIVIDCSINSSPLGKITVLRPEDPLYDINETDYIALKDGRKLVYEQTYFPDCIGDYGNGKIKFNILRDILKTATLSSATQSSGSENRTITNEK